MGLSERRVSPNVLYVGDVVPVRIYPTSEPFLARVTEMTRHGVRVFSPSDDPMVDQEHVVGYGSHQ